jgi:hypothetical protein
MDLISIKVVNESLRAVVKWRLIVLKFKEFRRHILEYQPRILSIRP